MSAAQDGRAHTWPPGVSDGLTLPCMRCGAVPSVDYRVDDSFWCESTTTAERQNVVCLECLCAVHAGVALHLREVQVVNGGATVRCEPTLTVDHATGRASGPDHDDGRVYAIEASGARIRELETTLAFYADPATYIEGTPPPGELSGPVLIERDKGAIARAALTEPETTA